MKKMPFLGCLFIPVLVLSGQTSLEDKPLKGEWLFNPEKIWEVSKAGDDEFGDHLVFSSPSNLLIKDEYVYVILENEQGRKTLARYRIALPQ